MTSSDDPYRNFRYRITWNGRYVDGYREIGDLPRSTDHTGYRKSGSPAPAIGPKGQGCFYLSLKHGVTFDLGFERWVSMVRCDGPATGKGSLLPEYKRPCSIEVHDESGTVEYAYHLSGCWIAEYDAKPGPDISANEITIGLLQIGFGSWEREPEEK